MKKLGVVLLLVFFVAVVSASSFELYNITVDTSYSYNNVLRGGMNVSFTDIPANTTFRTNMNQSVLLRDILNVNGYADSFCDPYGCSTRYEIKEEVSSLEFDLDLGEEVYFGFSLSGGLVSVNDVSFSMESDFEESENVPLIMNFLESSEDSYYNEYSDIVFREKYFGCYKSSGEIVGPKIGSTTYCSKVGTYETDRLIVGANISLEGVSGENVTMTLYDPDLPAGGRSCSFDPSGAYNYCPIDFSEDDLLKASAYYLCLEAEGDSVDYKLYKEESSGTYCGFSYSGDLFNTSAALSPNKTKNYALFIQEAIYADASGLNDYNFSEFYERINPFISSKYRNDCSGDCVFPIKLSAGVAQTIGISDFELSYSVDNEEYDLFNISELDVEYALMNFSGKLDFDELGILMNETGNYEFYIGDKRVLNETIRITPAPIIEGIFPKMIPAGINVLINADIDYDDPNASLSYTWNFGDGSSQTTNTNKVYHLFDNISEYEVEVVVTAGNLTNSRKEVITTISPKNYVGLIYAQVGINLNNTLDNISLFPAWQQRILEESLDVLTYQDQLSRIGNKIDEAFTDEDYLEIAGMLVDLDVPKSVYVSEQYTYDFSPGESINLAAIEEYTSEVADEGSESDYIDAIVRWQDENVAFSTTVKKVSLEKTSGSVYDVFVTYLIRATVDSDYQAFLVLNHEREEFVFNNVIKEPRGYGGATIVDLEEGENTVEFYLPGNQDLDFFVSTNLGNLVLEADVVEDCNFNFICEDGETPDTCRSDCKPVSLMIIYMILAFVLGLILYAGVQIWYSRYYEKTLFKDRRRLYNLLMFIASSKLKGMSRMDVRKLLKEKGWTSERIEYVIKKANGERTGMYEIIPITKIGAMIRQKKASKGGGVNSAPRGGMPMGEGGLVNRKAGIRRFLPGKKGVSSMEGGGGAGATSTRQQSGRKINKGDKQNFNRGR